MGFKTILTLFLMVLLAVSVFAGDTVKLSQNKADSVKDKVSNDMLKDLKKSVNQSDIVVKDYYDDVKDSPLLDDKAKEKNKDKVSGISVAYVVVKDKQIKVFSAK